MWVKYALFSDIFKSFSLIYLTLLRGQFIAAQEENLSVTNVHIPIQNSENTSAKRPDVVFSEEQPFKLTEGNKHTITWYSNVPGVKRADVFLEDDFNAVITQHVEYFSTVSSVKNEYQLISNISDQDLRDVTIYGYINVTGKFVGFNKVYVNLYGTNNLSLANGTMRLDVLLRKQFLTKVYSFCLTAILIIVYTNMGANLDLNLVKKIFKEPVGPAIGLFCQYGCMPMIAFGLGLLIFPNDPLYRLGLFASGSSPGGGLSNMWTHLLGGSLDLSIMMTSVSTVAALGFVPLWLLTIGPVIVEDANLVIPYKNVVIGIFILIVPCFIGITIQLKCPRITNFMKKTITPLSVFNICFIFSFGVYANFYLFTYISWQAVLAGIGQSVCGHLAGIIFALLFRRSKKEIIAISVETAVQNNGVAFVLLKLSLESPAGDLAVLMPGSVTLFMPLLLVIPCVGRFVYLKFFKKKDVNKNNELSSAKKKNSQITEATGNDKMSERIGNHNPALTLEEQL